MDDKMKLQFSIPDIAYCMLQKLCEELECTVSEGCELAVFHFIGSYEHEKLQREQEVHDGKD